MKLVPNPESRRRQLSTGSPEAWVHTCTDLELQDKERVAKMTRGLHWEPEPERFLAAAEAELEWRRENGLVFGWVQL